MRRDLGNTVLLLATALTLAACDESSSPGVPAGATLGIVSGDHQVGLVGEAVQPLVVRVDGADGAPLAGVGVEFTGVALPDRGLHPGCASGQLGATAATDVEGLASTEWTLGPCPGGAQVEARLVRGRARPGRDHHGHAAQPGRDRGDLGARNR